MITGSVVHNFVRIQEGLVCDMDKCFAVNHTAFTIVDEEDGGWQRLLSVQLLRNHLADYFLIPAVSDFHQWGYVSSVKLIIMQYEK
jgi:hypothetical protein